MDVAPQELLNPIPHPTGVPAPAHRHSHVGQYVPVSACVCDYASILLIDQYMYICLPYSTGLMGKMSGPSIRFQLASALHQKATHVQDLSNTGIIEI